MDALIILIACVILAAWRINRSISALVYQAKITNHYLERIMKKAEEPKKEFTQS